MKKICIVTILLLAGFFTVFFAPKKEETFSSVMLMNIEALSNPEYEVTIYCFGKGKVDCPIGVKVEWYASGYGLR